MTYYLLFSSILSNITSKIKLIQVSLSDLRIGNKYHIRILIIISLLFKTVTR